MARTVGSGPLVENGEGGDHGVHEVNAYEDTCFVVLGEKGKQTVIQSSKLAACEPSRPRN
jgi:hypothetical protein